MAYIGKEPAVGNFQVCDAISVVNGQAAYTMQVDSVNVVPESANHMLVSLNGILQKPGSSFTVSGSTITFASNLATGDVIDFIQILGSVLDLGVPSDATVTNAKTNFTSTSSAAGLQIKGDGTTDGTLQLNCRVNSHGIKLKSPPHSAAQSYTLTFPSTAPQADKALITDGSGNLSFGDAGGGKVLQAVYGSTNTQATSNVSSFADTGLTATITPSATSSKVLVIVNQNGLYKQGADIRMQAKLLRGSTNLGNFCGDETLRTSSSASFDMGGTGFSYLDSPSTTSATVYKTQFRNVDNTNTIEVQNGSSVSSITLLEISA